MLHGIDPAMFKLIAPLVTAVQKAGVSGFNAQRFYVGRMLDYSKDKASSAPESGRGQYA